MQVSSPESGEVAAAVRKWRASSLAPQTEWFPNRMFQRFGLGNHPTAANKEVVSIFLLPQFPLLTQEGSSPASTSPIAGNSRYRVVPGFFNL
jgi:hypothetical protein